MEDKKVLAILAYGNLSADTLKNLSADTLKNLKNIMDLVEKIPVIEKPYSAIWNDVKDNKRIHDQSTFGPECVTNVCGTAMCTAGHLVNLGGKAAYDLRRIVGWSNAASFVHQKSTSKHLPEQNYNAIPQEWAMAFLEENARMENEGE